MPFWIYLIVAGILFSAYMTIRTSKEEKELEMMEAEQEGNIILERMKEEREKRKEVSSGA
ncbi:sporulation YhaL family protein [Bacillus kwashiorkori]|uniref:sporulation YhaL family protein n=1 Tax=Bacillus kwashiorkori TaxID=1522318 RepID=UPI0007835FD9|nr:sporulation YhaL family protein [Bacillus kwashiorkori]